jgi:5-deoxy-glucuronate isomerase
MEGGRGGSAAGEAGRPAGTVAQSSRATVEGAASLLRRPQSPDAVGRVMQITVADAGWKYVGLDVNRLTDGQAVSIAADDKERLVLVLEGRAEVRAGDSDFGLVGSRDSVFDGPPPPVILVAPGCAISCTAHGRAMLVIGSAPGGDLHRTALIPADQVFVEERGTGQTARRIHHLMPPAGAAGRLIAFEVFTPGGNWSSFPPHKHDTEDPPREAYLEELYFYRFRHPHGFAVQRVYTADRDLDATITANDGDVILVPRGYHVVGAAAGYDTYYLNMMAGPNRAWHFTVDPDHAWLMDWDPAAPKSR